MKHNTTINESDRTIIIDGQFFHPESAIFDYILDISERTEFLKNLCINNGLFKEEENEGQLLKPVADWEIKGFSLVCGIAEYITQYDNFQKNFPEGAEIINEFKSVQLLPVQAPPAHFLDKVVNPSPKMAVQMIHIIYFKVPKYLNKTENEKDDILVRPRNNAE